MSTHIMGTLACELTDGPLDGTRYGDLPDNGEPFTSATLSVPLSQPAHRAAHAVYTCDGSCTDAGLLQFHFVRVDPPAAVPAPAGTHLSLAPAATWNSGSAPRREEHA
ncbi:hypothetical protein GCM10022240_04160 [Microbacterium kribbense]|uniref:Uncharacterized protein n=1 Tax=Microbacterium kribbense TaxID=433645 RepID=A0ABP7G2C9_9MICO